MGTGRWFGLDRRGQADRSRHRIRAGANHREGAISEICDISP